MPRCSRSSSHERMASASAAKIPPSRRAGAHRAAGGFDTDLPRRAGTVRGFSGGRRAYRRQKSVPGRLRGEKDVRTRIPSAPAPLRHRDSAPEAPPSRSSTARAALPCPIPPTGLGDVRSSERHPASPPLSRKTSDLPPGIGISIGPPILTSAKQRTSKTTQQHNCTTTQQQNKTAQLGNRRP